MAMLPLTSKACGGREDDGVRVIGREERHNGNRGERGRVAGGWWRRVVLGEWKG